MTPAARAYASRASVRFALCAIVAAYLGFATLWAIRVPPFAPPDEMAHTDYMYAFFDAGRFYRVDSRLSANDVLPQTRYLERISGYRRLHYNVLGRVPAGYGTRTFFAAARSGAPPVTNAVRPQGSVMPYVMSVYPSTYYVLVAAIARATFDATRSVVDSFFAARACSVALGAATLVFAFATFRRRGFGDVTSLLCVASIAMLPLFCWVSAYVQPDNLVIFLVTLTLWAAAGKRRVPQYAALAVCGILLVKPLYGAVVWLPVAAYAAAIARDRSSRFAAGMWLGALPALALVASLHLTPVSGGLADLGETANAVHAAGLAQALHIARPLGGTLANIYLGGPVFTNYWLAYGAHETPYLAVPVTRSLVPIYVTVTAMALAAFACAYARRAVRIARAGRRRGVVMLLRLVARGLPLNLYALYTALLVAASLLGSAPLALEARYWLALVVPLTILVVGDIARVFPRNARATASFVLATGLVLMALPIGAFAPLAIERDYYAAPAGKPRFDFGGVVVGASGDDHASFLQRESRTRLQDRVTVRGFALDVVTGLPADRVAIVSDGRVVARARPSRWNPEPAQEWHDDELARAAFVATIPAAAFGIGRHDVAIVASRAGGTARPLKHHVTLVVTRRVRPGQP